ncbi:MAG: nucleotidyltransferase domain-containing protein, partial [Oscillospiraceae bacterium]|nr:nucleotidyltransferase domain-containing protein [Oscillospiraceae bacterium]
MLETEELLKRYTEESRRILGDCLVGIYLHGSLAMGCYNPNRSDIDLIVVTDGSLTDEVKREFLDMTVRYNAQGPAKGIEMSIVRREFCDP